MAKQNGIKTTKQLKNSEQQLKKKHDDISRRFTKTRYVLTLHDAQQLRVKEALEVERSKLYYGASSVQWYLSGGSSHYHSAPKVNWSAL